VVTGTVGVLEQAATKNLVELPTIIRRLCETKFRITLAVINDVLSRAAAKATDSDAAQSN
jgi:predicted nucleic acid-binding protein